MPIRRIFLVMLLLYLALTILFGGTAMGGDLLAYKPYAEPFDYRLRIRSHAVIDPGTGGGQGGIFREHEDNLTINQQVKDAGEGLLDFFTTVKTINILPNGPPYGAVYKREDVPGNTQKIRIDLLGQVHEAKVIPHLGSSAFWRKGDDGPPLDFYNILLMLIPRFRLGILSIGDTWLVEDEIKPGLAEAMPLTGNVVPNYALEMAVHQSKRYTLDGFENIKGFRCARIGFEAEFRTNGVMRDAYTGSYLQGNGKSVGEFFFAPKEGVLVEASMEHQANERLSKDGHIVRFLSPEEMVFLHSDDHKTVPLPWRAHRTVTLELIKDR